MTSCNEAVEKLKKGDTIIIIIGAVSHDRGSAQATDTRAMAALRKGTWSWTASLEGLGVSGGGGRAAGGSRGGGSRGARGRGRIGPCKY